MWKCEIPLRDYQEECLNNLSKDQREHNSLLVSIPTGGGKTIIFTTFSLNTGYRTLVIAHRDELLEQAVAKYRMVGGNILETGFIRAGEWKEGKFTVASIQTLYRNLNRIDGRKWDLVVVDECLVEGTLITTADGGVKRIEEIKDGDKVVGGEVSNSFSRKSKVFVVKTEVGELICTGTHPHIVLVDGKIKELTTLELMNLLKERRDSGKPKPKLLSPKRVPHTVRNSLTKEQLEFVSLILTDGTMEKSGRIKVSLRKEDKKNFVRRIFRKGVEAFGIQAKVKESVNGRGDWVIWVNSKELCRILEERFRVGYGKKAHRIDIVPDIFYAPEESLKGFIRVAFDCDGDLSTEKRNGKAYCRLNFNSTSREFVYKLRLLLLKFGIQSKIYHYPSKNERANPVYRLSITGEQLNRYFRIIGSYRYKPVFNSYNGGFGEVNDNYVAVSIFGVEETGEVKTVYDFTVSPSHTYLANGLLTHNCHHLPAPTYRAVIDRIVETNPEVKILGFTATPFRADKQDLKEFFDKMSFSIDILELMARGYLVPLKGYLVPLPVDMSELKTTKNANGEVDYTRSSIAKAFNTPEVNKAIVDKWLELASDRKTIFYTARRDHAKALWAEFEKAGISSAYVDGEMPLSERRTILNAFKKGDVQVLTNVDVLTEGFDDPEVDCIGLVRPTKSLNLYAQIVGRGLRIAPNKKNCLLLDFTGVSQKHTLVGLPELFGIEEIREHWEKGEAISVGAGAGGGEKENALTILVGDGKEELVFDAYEVQKYAVKVSDGWIVIVGRERFLWLYPAENGTYNIDEVNTDKKSRKTLKKNLTEDYAWSILTTLWKFKKEDWVKEYESRAIEQYPTFKQKKILVSAVNSGYLPDEVGELTRQKASALISYLVYQKGKEVLFMASPKTFDVIRIDKDSYVVGYADRFFPYPMEMAVLNVFVEVLKSFGFAFVNAVNRGFFETKRTSMPIDDLRERIFALEELFWKFVEYPIRILDIPATYLDFSTEINSILKKIEKDIEDDDLFDF